MYCSAACNIQRSVNIDECSTPGGCEEYVDIASYPPAVLSYLSNFIYIKIFKGAPFIYIKIYNKVKLASYF